MGFYETGEQLNATKLQAKMNAAINSPGNGKCIELFAGQGNLTRHYSKLFKEVVANDRQNYDGLHHTMEAADFIREHLPEHTDFDLIDLDDEGSPAQEIRLLFETLSSEHKTPFILAVTNTGIHKLREHAYTDMGRYPSSDYHRFQNAIRDFVSQIAARNGYMVNVLVNDRRENGTTVYAAFNVARG